MNSRPRVALVTDWLTNLGGGERVLLAVTKLFPEAPIFTSVFSPQLVEQYFPRKKVVGSFLQKFRLFQTRHQWTLPLLPAAIESLDLSKYDLVLSFSSAVAKSVQTDPKTQLHICYNHCPMRWAWEPDFDARVLAFSKLLRVPLRLVIQRLKRWDYATRNRPQHYIANSQTTAKRLKAYYGVEASVLFPPVGEHLFSAEKCRKERYWLGLGRWVTYKKFDLLVRTFALLPEEKLILVGRGPMLEYWQKWADQHGLRNITFLGWVSDERRQKLLSQAQGLLHPQLEDAGITQLEAMACGTPVIAYGAGGALEVVQPKVNGLLHEAQTPRSLITALEQAKKQKWDFQQIQSSVKSFGEKAFLKRYQERVDEVWQKFNSKKRR